MIEGSIYQIIAQGIGICGSAILIFSFTRKDDDHFKWLLVLGNFVFFIHFFMLGAYAGMFVNFLNGVRVTCSIKFHKSTKLMVFFLAAYFITGIVLYETWYDILPVFAALLGTYSLFKLSGIKMRLTAFIGACAWLTYGIIFKSIGGIITEIAIICMNSLTVFRMWREKKLEHEQNT